MTVFFQELPLKFCQHFLMLKEIPYCVLTVFRWFPQKKHLSARVVRLCLVPASPHSDFDRPRGFTHGEQEGRTTSFRVCP